MLRIRKMIAIVAIACMSFTSNTLCIVTTISGTHYKPLMHISPKASEKRSAKVKQFFKNNKTVLVGASIFLTIATILRFYMFKEDNGRPPLKKLVTGEESGIGGMHNNGQNKGSLVKNSDARQDSLLRPLLQEAILHSTPTPQKDTTDPVSIDASSRVEESDRLDKIKENSINVQDNQLPYMDEGNGKPDVEKESNNIGADKQDRNSKDGTVDTTQTVTNSNSDQHIPEGKERLKRESLEDTGDKAATIQASAPVNNTDVVLVVDTNGDKTSTVDPLTPVIQGFTTSSLQEKELITKTPTKTPTKVLSKLSLSEYRKIMKKNAEKREQERTAHRKRVEYVGKAISQQFINEAHGFSPNEIIEIHQSAAKKTGKVSLNDLMAHKLESLKDHYEKYYDLFRKIRSSGIDDEKYIKGYLSIKGFLTKLNTSSFSSPGKVRLPPKYSDLASSVKEWVAFGKALASVQPDCPKIRATLQSALKQVAHCDIGEVVNDAVFKKGTDLNEIFETFDYGFSVILETADEAVSKASEAMSKARARKEALQSQPTEGSHNTGYQQVTGISQTSTTSPYSRDRQVTHGNKTPITSPTKRGSSKKKEFVSLEKAINEQALFLTKIKSSDCGLTKIEKLTSIGSIITALHQLVSF